MIDRIYSNLWHLNGKGPPKHEPYKKPVESNIVGQKAMIPPDRAFDTIDISELGITISKGQPSAVEIPPIYGSEPEIIPDHIVDNRPKRDPNDTGLISGYKIEDIICLDDFATVEDFQAYINSLPKSSFHKFFDSKTDFFADAAKEYAKIDKNQEYYLRPTNDSEFINTALDWMYGTEATEQDKADMTTQIDAIVRELAEQIKNGGEADISKLESKLSFRGEEISLSQFIEMRDVTGKLMSEANLGSPRMGNGEYTFENFAKMGLVKSVSSNYFDSISSGVAKQFKSVVNDILDTQMKLDKEAGLKGDWHIRSVVAVNEEAYKRMSNLDTTDEKTLKSSFNQHMGWYKNTLSNKFFDSTAEKDTNALRTILNSLMDITK